jgi:hypothetical protein
VGVGNFAAAARGERHAERSAATKTCPISNIPDKRRETRKPRTLVVAASVAAHLLPAAHQLGNFSGTFIWSAFAPDDRNELIQQVCFDWVFNARLIYCDQRSSEPIKALNTKVPMILTFQKGGNLRCSRIDLCTIGNLFALHVMPLLSDVVLQSAAGARCSPPHASEQAFD